VHERARSSRAEVVAVACRLRWRNNLVRAQEMVVAELVAERMGEWELSPNSNSGRAEVAAVARA
jgi:hypothetical protein